MKDNLQLTIDNWKNEYKRLETKYNKIPDKTSLEGRGVSDHMMAVRAIIREIEAKERNKQKFSINLLNQPACTAFRCLFNLFQPAYD